MKVAFFICLLIGLLLFQSGVFTGEWKVIASILGVTCFVGLIAWFFYEKKREASDPVVMLSDLDSD